MINPLDVIINDPFHMPDPDPLPLGVQLANIALDLTGGDMAQAFGCMCGFLRDAGELLTDQQRAALVESLDPTVKERVKG